MPEIIAVANRKGGCGKTSACHAIGADLLKRGYSTLMVDMDGQKNLSYIMRADTDGVTAFDVLTGKSSAAEAIQHTEQGDIIPASTMLENADVSMPSDGVTRLRDALVPIHESYDFIILDTPPSAGILTLNALIAANGLVIPAKADIFSLEGVEQMGDVVGAVRNYNARLKIYGILLSCFDGRKALSRAMVNALTSAAEGMGTRLFDTRIRDSVAIPEAQAMQKSIYKSRSKPARDYSSFVDELLALIEVEEGAADNE